MAQPNGASAAPSDETLPDEAAIDAAIDTADEPVLDGETHRLVTRVAELEQHLRAKDEVLSRSARELDEIKKTSRQQSEMLSKLVGGMEDAQIRGYWHQRDQLEEIQRKATAEADVATFDRAREAIRALDYQRAAGEQKGKKAQPDADTGKQPDQPQQVDPAVTSWVADNAWVREPKMWREATALEQNIAEDNPGLAISERLKQVKAEMAKRHPTKFPADARQPPQAVSRPGPQTAKAKPKGKTEADLPASARAAMEKFVKQGVLTKEQYLKDFQWD
jgi:hypothetical protein